MSGSPSLCIGSLQFPYSSVNFWQGDQRAFLYPALSTSGSSASCYGQLGTNGDLGYYQFSVALIGPRGSSYVCNDLEPGSNNVDDQTINCPGVSRDSLLAGTYNLRFTTVSDGSVSNGPSLSISRNDRLNSCADSIFFPDKQDTFNFRSDDPNPVFTTIGYSSYQCAGYNAFLPSYGGGLEPYLFHEPNYYPDEITAVPGTSPDANPYNSPLTKRVTFFNRFIRGTVPDGLWTTGVTLFYSALQSREISNTFTISHDDTKPPVQSAKGFKRRQNVGICPIGHERCLVPGTQLTECLNIMNNIDACGGCPGTNASVDCATLSDTDTMSCIDGVCVAQVSTEGWGLVLHYRIDGRKLDHDLAVLGAPSTDSVDATVFIVEI